MNRETKPNIIFMLSDQQRADTCGCYGQKLDVTPNLDQLAQDGTRFEHAFSVQPVCGPARSCLQTGLYATQTGCYRNGVGLPRGTKTIAEGLSEAGYEVGYLGKWHLASTSDALADEFRDAGNYWDAPVPPSLRGGYKDFWLASDCLEWTSHGYAGHMYDADMNKREFPEGRFRADVQTDWALEYLDSRDLQKPFFLFASYIEPHHQNDTERYEGPHGSKQRWNDFEVPGDLAGTEGDWRENYPDYLGCCHALDRGLGRIRAKLEERGIAENTIIIYTSDHGSHFKTRNAEYKRSCHESSIRVPLVISGPGFEGGNHIEDLVSLIDLPKSLLNMAGAEPWREMQGSDLGGLVNGDGKGWPTDVFYQISESCTGRGIRTHRWKYAVTAPEEYVFGGSATCYLESFLYDLDADPHERNNLVAEPSLADLRAELAERLIQRMVQAGEEIPVIEPAACRPPAHA